MLYEQTMEYAYIRMRSTYVEDDGQEVVYVFAALRLVKEQVLGDLVRQQMKPILAESVTLPVNEAPKEYLTLPYETTHIIYRTEFEYLRKVAKKDLQKFFLYRTDYDTRPPLDN